MSLPPANTTTDAAMENWEIRSEQIKGEETEKQQNIEETFRQTEEFKILNDTFSKVESGGSILNAIVTNYGITEDTTTAIEKTFGDKTSLKRLGLSLNAADRQELISQLLSEIGIEDSGVPDNFEEAILRESDESIDGGEEEEAGIEPSKEHSEGDKTQDISEIPGIPKLQRLSENGTISFEDFTDITEGIENGQTLESSVTSIMTDVADREEVLAFFEEKDPEKRSADFFKNMPDVVENDSDNPTVQLIAENYTEMSGGKGIDGSIENDFKTAIQEAGNKVVDGKVFKRTEGFERAMATIKAGENKQDMFTALSEVHGYVNQYTGTRGKDTAKKLKLTQIKKAESLAEKEVTFGELIAKAKKNANTEQQARIEKAMSARQAEENELIQTGDLGMGGEELDLLSELGSESPKKAA